MAFKLPKYFDIIVVFQIILNILALLIHRSHPEEQGQGQVWGLEKQGIGCTCASAALKTEDRVRNVFPETWLLSNASVGFAQCSSFDDQLVA